jgi:hypothetical protein
LISSEYDDDGVQPQHISHGQPLQMRILIAAEHIDVSLTDDVADAIAAALTTF